MNDQEIYSIITLINIQIKTKMWHDIVCCISNLH